MKHVKCIGRRRPMLAVSFDETLHYIDSFGWLLVNFINIFQNIARKSTTIA
ncbi:MAG: hypothetical protein WCW56_03705 [Candidatus Paceibacterota bacterium]|jgi:hypothetical protein